MLPSIYLRSITLSLHSSWTSFNSCKHFVSNNLSDELGNFLKLSMSSLITAKKCKLFLPYSNDNGQSVHKRCLINY